MIIHIKNLRSKNKVIKRNSKYLLFNMKLLLFIDNDKIEYFFELIKNKYYGGYKRFYRLF